MPGSSAGRTPLRRVMPKAQIASVLEPRFLHALKELGVFLVRQRIAPFDEVEAQIVEPLGDQQLVLQRKVDPFALAAVAERRVVDLDAHASMRGWVNKKTLGPRLASGRMTVGGDAMPLRPGLLDNYYDAGRRATAHAGHKQFGSGSCYGFYGERRGHSSVENADYKALANYGKILRTQSYVNEAVNISGSRRYNRDLAPFTGLSAQRC